MTEIRTTPRRSTANDQGVFIWALYLFGGTDKDAVLNDGHVMWDQNK